MEQEPSGVAANFDVEQLLAAVTARPGHLDQQRYCADETGDSAALWCACLRELTTRCRESDVAQFVVNHAIVRRLLTLDLSAEKKKKTATKLRVARWDALAEFAQSGIRALRQQLRSQSGLVLRLAARERFEAREVLAAMAKCVVALASDADRDGSLLDVKRCDDDDDEGDKGDSKDDIESGEDDASYLTLLKQMYVTLSDAALRRALVASLRKLIASKEHVKAAVRAGVLRALLQVAIDDSHATLRTHEQETQDDGTGDDVADNAQPDLMLNCANVLAHVATLVCFTLPVPPPPPPAAAAAQNSELATAPDSSSELLVCERVVALLLSGVSVAFQEGVRLLQMIVENPRLRALVVGIADLRGALEKAHALAQQHESQTRVLDPYVATLSRQQFDQLRPEIDAFERARGISLVGLPSDPSVGVAGDMSRDSLDTALALATYCKERGNWYFKRGNFPTARGFYRRAISLLRMAQRAREQQLAALHPADVLRQCSAGASVQVQSRSGGAWRNAMVADVESGLVEVIFDDDDTEEAVDPSRVRLRLTTTVLDTYEALEVDCAMNMGKAFAQLHEHERAAECFSHALKVKRDRLGAALYHRGVAHLALHDLKSAQQDLWRANELARPAGDKALVKLVSAAYKKLQALHANKKRMDKRVVKEMMRYLSTVMPSGGAETALGEAQ